MPPIIALDFANLKETLSFLKAFDPKKLAIKVGMELFDQEGPQAVAALQQIGITNIFLDLKLHDIPNTVERAAERIGALGVQLTTIHALGGATMIQAAKRGLERGAAQAGVSAPKLLAVTVLTSHSEDELSSDFGITESLADFVDRLATLALANGADGVVASAAEAERLRTLLPSHAMIVTPGIRPTGYQADDQARVVTPQQAAQNGASGIVVGRPITQAANPVSAYDQILAEWSQNA